MANPAKDLVRAVSIATNAAKNEAQLRHAIEIALQKSCNHLGIPWTPFQLDRSLKGNGKTTRFVDVAHGAVIIEYEPPNCFAGNVGSKLIHARQQAEEYATLMSIEEGRPLSDYVLVAWDGASINFGTTSAGTASWESVSSFNNSSAQRLLDYLKQNGIPIVHPRLLADLVGPDSAYGNSLIPEFYKAINSAASVQTTKTKLLFTEWRRLFGQVVGVQSESLQQLLARQGNTHGQDYKDNPSAYLFALNTYIALLAKLVAACALPSANQNILDASVGISSRIAKLETGELFEHAGIQNMLAGDFFSWYADDLNCSNFERIIEELVARLAGISFDMPRKSAASTRDLFKGIYESFVPRALRHALGEFYTPDWLAEHGLDTVGWHTNASLLDPTCGSGTFILDALRRRLIDNCGNCTAKELLHGLYGIDLNPLAVLAAKGSLAVYLSPFLDSSVPVHLPVFLADAINPASADDGKCYKHILQTELGPQKFEIPEKLILNPDFFRVFSRVRGLVDNDRNESIIWNVIDSEFPDLGLDDAEIAAFKGTLRTLVNLHAQGWNGIWCSVIADRFAAGAIPPTEFICGNPPWVKWSHLPPEYAEFIKPRCLSLGVFSSDRWVGGIESDISTVITYEAISKYLASQGKLGFFITGTVFTNESSEGFRQFKLGNSGETCAVQLVEDFTAVAPFDGVSNRPTFLVIKKTDVTQFPITYRTWRAVDSRGKRIRQFGDATEFRKLAVATDMEARPVRGGSARPWIVGSNEQQAVFDKVLGATQPNYAARKGITTDRNGIFWVKVNATRTQDRVKITNDAAVGRTKGIPTVRAIVENTHVFPLLRGRGVMPFSATPDLELRVLVPQRGMHGDPKLDINAPLTFKFLANFKEILEKRSSYRRFQQKQGHPFYSLWSTGPYTFSNYKVLWREMSGGDFAAAYIGSVEDPVLGHKVVIPDHKLYFIPVDTECEAAYLTGFLNAETVASSISAYASQLSLGASVAEYLRIPTFDALDSDHKALAEIAIDISSRTANVPTDKERALLDTTVRKILGVK